MEKIDLIGSLMIYLGFFIIYVYHFYEMSSLLITVTRMLDLDYMNQNVNCAVVKASAISSRMKDSITRPVLYS